MVSLATKRNKQWIRKDKLEIQKASVEDIPYPDNHFNKVFTCNTIYFWPDPVENANEIRRVLKPGGQLYCAMRMKERMESLNSVIRDNSDVFQNLYHEGEVELLLETAGFKRLEIHSKSDDSDTFYVACGVN